MNTYKVKYPIQDNEQKKIMKEGTIIMKQNLVKALETLQAQATTNPADITSILRKWELAENYDATTISIFDATGQTIYDSIDKIYARYTGTRIDAIDDPAYLTALRLLRESLDCTGISRVVLLDCLSTYWSDFKWIPLTYDILIALAGSLKYYEEQIPAYERIINHLNKILSVN